VYCREILQQEFDKLTDSDQTRLTDLFAPHGGLEALHADGVIKSGMAEKFVLPRDPQIHEKYKQTLTQLIYGQPRN
jgi:hypothetical protein